MRIIVKLARPALAGALAAMAALVAPAVPASAAATHASSPAHVLASGEPCYNTVNNTPSDFTRCTSNSQNGSWSGVTCTVNHNYNAGSGAFNVYAVESGCYVRVWLHQYRDWSKYGGWEYCISPGYGQSYLIVDSNYVHPYNIYISDNTNHC